MNWTLIKAVMKARRDGLFRLVPADEPTRLDCLVEKSAKCCRALGLPVVTEAEAEKIGVEYVRRCDHGMVLRSKHSICCMLKDGLCTIYADRPRGCREYPWYNIGGKLYYDSGCPGIKHDRDERPDVSEIQPFENFFPDIPMFVLHLIKRICITK